MAEYGDTTNGEQYQATDDAQSYDQSGYEESGSGDQPGSTGDKINASKNDDDSRKIFVGGLSWETTAKDLKEYFGKFGTVLDCSLKTDQITGRSRGFGFVLFSETGAVDKVLAQAHVLHGKTIDPKKAKARGGREPIKKVFVGGLDPTVPEATIREHFEKFGTIEEIDLPFDKMKGQRRAFCFITFDSEATVDKVCADPKQKIGDADKEVDVKKATPKNEQGSWGGYGGRGGARGGWGGQRGGGGGRGGRGGYDQSGWGNQNYGNYGDYYNQGYGGGYYDYNNQAAAYTGYDYNNYYGNQGWGNYGNQGYGNYGSQGNSSYSGYGSGQQQQQGGSNYKAKGASRGGATAGASHGYHPYSR